MQHIKFVFTLVAASVVTTLFGMPSFGADPVLLGNIRSGKHAVDVEGATQDRLFVSTGSAVAIGPSGDSVNKLLPKEIDGEFFAMGSVALFGYSDDYHGQELWRSDGTRAGTYLVKDLVEGPESGGPRTFVQWRGKVYFTTTIKPMDTGAHYAPLPQLWSTDGTPEGTHLISEIDTRTWFDMGDDHLWAASGYISQLIAGQDRLFFNVDLYSDDRESREITLWKSDGTAQGTVKMVNPETNQPLFASNLLQSVGDVTYFADNQPYWSDYLIYWDFGKLWRLNSDGEQRTLVTEALASPSIAVFGGRVYFTTRDDDGLHLARTSEDGNSVETLALLYPASSLGLGMEIKWVAGATSLFFGIDGGDSGSAKFGADLWRFSIAEQSTTKVYDLLTFHFGTHSMAAKDDLLYFSNGPADNVELWRSDGTPEGTGLYRDLNPAGSSNPRLEQVFAGEIWFSAYQGSSVSLFRTEGNDSVVKVDIDLPGAASSHPRQFTSLNNGLTLFRGKSWNYELFATAGTPETTVRPQIRTNCDTCQFEPLLPLGNGALFLDTLWGTLWYTNGGDEKLFVKNVFWPAVINNYPITKNVLTPLSTNTALFFAVEKNVGLTLSRKLWRTDGTAEGTVLVKTMAFPAPPFVGFSLQGIEALVRHKHLVYFMGNDDRNGNELWRSDGTDTGTFMVKDLVPGNARGSIRNITSARNQIYFTYADDYGTYLAKSRGSEKDTMHIATLPGNIKSIQNATSVNDSLFFRAGSALYRSNGQRGDLRRLGVFGFNSASEAPYYRQLPTTATLPAAMIAYGDHLYFVARKGAKDPLQVWRADTKKNKAEIVTPQFRVQASGANDMSFAVHAGRLFLAVMDRAGQNGGIFELRTSGKTMQWVRHTNMSARELRIASGKMYFAGLDDQYGEEPRVMPLPKRP